MWFYTVGHKTLLLRSPKAPNAPSRIDVLFVNVAAIHLPTILDSLMVSEATETEATDVPVLAHRDLEGRKVFAVRAGEVTGYVVAGAAAWHEDQREYDEPSHFPLTPAIEQ
jgi:hypothetical protein